MGKSHIYPYVENRMTNDKQMVVLWHINYLKVSHIDIFEITNFAVYMSRIYVGLTVHRVKVRDYFGMGLSYSEKGTVDVSMIRYLDSVLQEFPEHLGVTAATPDAEHLFKVRDERKKQYLLEDQAQTLHHTASKLLFVSSRAHQYIQTAVAFLTTRVKKPDEDDWGKLKRVLEYLK